MRLCDECFWKCKAKTSKLFFFEKVKADVVYDAVKRQNPVDFKALKEAKEHVVRWRRACEIFISEQKKGEVG